MKIWLRSVRGPGNLGPPVLLIHGGGPGGIVFDLVALALRWPKIRGRLLGLLPGADTADSRRPRPLVTP